MRRDIWEPLNQKATRDNPVRIGLFDSGNGVVYEAWVSQVIQPQADQHGALPVPPGEEDLVPPYYRTSPYSRAWMRLTRINPQDIEFFGRHSFDPLPPLPYYSKDVLGKFEDKVIRSSAELLGMDTTIWRVRERRDRDHDEEIILTTHSLSLPVSRESVDLQSNTILHITDPHYSVGHHRNQHVWRLESEAATGMPTLAEAINRAIARRPVGAIIVTGDLTFTGEVEEFEEAATSLTKLFGLLNLDKDRLVVVPGNHDIRWTATGDYDENAVVTEAPERAKTNYEAFYHKMFGHNPNVTLSMGRRFILPCGIPVEVCAVNSSSLETGPNFLAGMGRVQEAALTEIANTLGWDVNGGLALRVLALHHHLTLTEDLEPFGNYYRGYGIAVDAPRITRLAASFGVQLALHGHKHRAFLWRSGVYELPEHTQPRWKLGNLSIIGGGSAGSQDTDGDRNYFNLININASAIEVTMFHSQNRGAFGQMKEWAAGIELKGSPPSLILSDWIER